MSAEKEAKNSWDVWLIVHNSLWKETVHAVKYPTPSF